MIILKKTLHLIFSVFLVWQTIMVIERLLFNPPVDFFSRLHEAIFINLFVTGIFTIVYSFPVYKLLPLEYYRINNPRLLKYCGQIMRIDLFKKILIKTIWKKQQNRKHFFNGLRNGFKEFETRTRQSEFGHFMGFCLIMILAIFIGIKSGLAIALMILFINIFFNFYPFMLQRFHRMRINELKR